MEGGTHEVRRVLSIDHEAASAIDAHEAEFGADGAAFGPSVPLRVRYRRRSQAPLIQAWNGDIASKRRVFRYMQEHGRERGADQWLREEYGGELDAFPVRMPGVEQTELSWRDVQRRIVKLLKKDRFFTDQELDNFDDVDPAEVGRSLLKSGIVNGEVVDPDALNANPFIQQVMADTERIAQEEPRFDEIMPGDQAGEPFSESITLNDGSTYAVGETVTIGGTEFRITDIGPFDVQLLDPTLLYPVFRSESHESFERLMQAEKERAAPDTVVRGNDSAITPYRQGDTVYLSGQPYEVQNVWENSVEIKELSQEPPVFRTLMKPKFEMLLFMDARNKHITEYLGADLHNADYTLQQVLTEDGGLLSPDDKETVSEWLRSGASNSEIAQRLAASYSGRASSLFLKNSEIIDYVTSDDGLEFSFGDREQTTLSFLWTTAAEIPRPMYQQERNGFSHEVSAPSVRAETTAYYSGEKLGLPYDIETQTLRVDEPEPEPPAPYAENYHISDVHLGEGGPKEKFWRNIKAIATLKQIEKETPPGDAGGTGNPLPLCRLGRSPGCF